VAFGAGLRHATDSAQQGVVIMKRVLIAVTALALAGPAFGQQVYKWVDKDGTVHFTDSPPADSVGAEKVVLRGNVQSTIVDVDPEQRGISSDEVDMLYTPEQRTAACDQSRANRTTLTNMAVVTMDKDGDGTVEELTDEEKAEQLARANDQIALLCVDGAGQSG
jgi:hypothetical protein